MGDQARHEMNRHITTDDELRQYEANVKKIKHSGDGPYVERCGIGPATTTGMIVVGGSDVRSHARVGSNAAIEKPHPASSLAGSEKQNRYGRAGSNPAPPPLLLALTGQLPSGKNQVQLSFKHGKVHKYPNKTYTNWRAKAHVEILGQVDWSQHTIITTPVRLTVEYWPGDARTRDVSGQLDALFHLLVYAKVLKDDGLVHDVTWRRHPINRKFPKVLLTIEEIA